MTILEPSRHYVYTLSSYEVPLNNRLHYNSSCQPEGNKEVLHEKPIADPYGKSEPYKVFKNIEMITCTLEEIDNLDFDPRRNDDHRVTLVEETSTF